MLKVLDWCARAFFVAVLLIMIYRVWLFFAPAGIDKHLRTDLIGAQQVDEFYTGFASVPLVQFKGQKGELIPLAELNGRASDVRGFCYFVFDVAIGYQSLGAALERSELRTADSGSWFAEQPAVIAANVIESRHGGKMYQFECDSVNLATNDTEHQARNALIQNLLQDYGQWQGHVDHAQDILTALSDGLRKAKLREITKRTEQLSGCLRSEDMSVCSSLSVDGTAEPTLLSADAVAKELADSQQAATRLEGILGTIKLTLSTIGIFSKERGFVFRKEDFYVRQDIANATFGTDFFLDLDSQRDGMFGSRKIVVELPTPRMLAIDRYSSLIVTNRKKFDPKDKSDDHDAAVRDPVEQAMTDSLQSQLTRLQPDTIDVTKRLLVSEIHSLIGPGAGPVTVRFIGAKPNTGDQLLQVLRYLDEQKTKPAN